MPLPLQGHEVFDLVKAFVSQAFFRCGVPMLACISGYLAVIFIRRSYISFLGTKVRTLVVPLVIWNLVNMLLVLFVTYFQIIDREFRPPSYPFQLDNWLQGIFAISQPPATGPLFFLRDLFVLNLLFPIFMFLLLNAPYIGLCAVTVVFYFDFDASLLLRNTMAINFYMGGMAALLAWDVRRFDRYWVVCLFLLVTASVFLILTDGELLDLFRVISPLLVWPISVALVRGRLGCWLERLSAASFSVFLCHGLVLSGLWIAFGLAGQPFAYPLFWFLAPVLAVAASHMVRRAAYFVAPSVARIAFGAR